MELILLAVIAWLGAGAAVAVIMGRRGYSRPAWGVIGMLLGPLALPLALNTSWARRPGRVSILASEPAGSGPISVLAAIDGSDEALTALVRAVGVLGDRLGRLSLVSVTSIDSATDAGLLEQEKALAGDWMAAARQRIPDRPAEEYVVPGRPSDTLTELAVDGKYDLLVVGSRGRGVSPRLFGSVALELAASSPVPILIGGQRSALAPQYDRFSVARR